ncbi:Oidioi.mRNA.OKI2018_I69.chr2.g4132.t1.cds [Oikopleura dioica]|uniref:Oidioi.mRNA.OKI2018_I69.chr2.g4132.t1.cds n=1 Tax=Oikopleura dioica TaxID=34765 RepID=A0ABN7T071_OIKDI|nr:Oidioi.mRNA.OKI2018_I69.chr2.g4132.t1.cds [Oikopleura dioica]
MSDYSESLISADTAVIESELNPIEKRDVMRKNDYMLENKVRNLQLKLSDAEMKIIDAEEEKNKLKKRVEDLENRFASNIEIYTEDSYLKIGGTESRYDENGYTYVRGDFTICIDGKMIMFLARTESAILHSDSYNYSQLRMISLPKSSNFAPYKVTSEII